MARGKIKKAGETEGNIVFSDKDADGVYRVSVMRHASGDREIILLGPTAAHREAVAFHGYAPPSKAIRLARLILKHMSA